MSMLVAMVRRSLWLVLLAAAGGTGYSWWRDRNEADTLAPPEWPPLPASSGTATEQADPATPATGASSTSAKSPAPEKPAKLVKPAASQESPATSTQPPSASTASTGSSGSGTATSSFVNALVDAPEARSSDGSIGGWVDALDNGSCPVSHPIKANDNSGIFHVPDGRFYDRTKPERCYTSDDAAIADGYRRAKN